MILPHNKSHAHGIDGFSAWGWQVTVGNNWCTIIADAANKDEIDARVAQIKQELAETDSTYDTEKLSERIAKLAGGVAVIKVLAHVQCSVLFSALGGALPVPCLPCPWAHVILLQLTQAAETVGCWAAHLARQRAVLGTAPHDDEVVVIACCLSTGSRMLVPLGEGPS